MSTGDILVFNKESFERANEKLSKENSELRNLLQINLEVAPPVFFCTVEPSSEAEEKKLIYALDCLQREDPSMRVSHDEQDNLGSMIIQGMGELHLEIIKDRILKEYNLNAYFGPLNIGIFKEINTFTFKNAIIFFKINKLTKKHQLFNQQNYSS